MNNGPVDCFLWFGLKCPPFLECYQYGHTAERNGPDISYCEESRTPYHRKPDLHGRWIHPRVHRCFHVHRRYRQEEDSDYGIYSADSIVYHTWYVLSFKFSFAK